MRRGGEAALEALEIGVDTREVQRSYNVFRGVSKDPDKAERDGPLLVRKMFHTRQDHASCSEALCST